MFRKLLLLGGYLLCISTGLPGAPPVKIIASQEYPGGGIVSSDVNPIAFVPSASGGIEAIDALRGKVFWSTKDANKPLLVNGENFLALAPVKDKPNQVKILTFDSMKGTKISESDPILFPEWVSVPVVHGRSFSSKARLEGKSLVFIWKAESFYAGGAEPTEEKIKAARRSAQGAIRMDLESGKVTEVKDYKVTDKDLPPNAVELRQMGLANMIIRIEDRGTNPAKMRRFIKANESLGSASWEHEIAAPVSLPAIK